MKRWKLDSRVSRGRWYEIDEEVRVDGGFRMVTAPNWGRRND